MVTREKFVSSMALAIFAALASATPAGAQVMRLEITSREPVANGQAFGNAGAYENLRGRIHGEVDPRDRRNAIVQDIDLAPRNARGNVEYVATFSLMKPVDLSKASGVLVYSVVNRGNGSASPSPEGHMSLVSGWQGDVSPTATNQTIAVPIARNRDGSSITGPVLARFWDLPNGTTTTPSIRIGSLGTAFYPPASLDTSKATLTFHATETVTGETTGVGTIAPPNWAFADCRTTPFPGAPDPTRVCVRDGFDPAKLYQLVYTAKDPLVLGIGLAAMRDIVSFFRHAAADATGTPNPVAKTVTHAVALGTSQSGNLIKTFIHLGFNEDMSGRIVWDGAFPYIAGRQTPINVRFGSPGGAVTLYEAGSEPALWWNRYTDATRGRKSSSLLDRCTATKTCPKIFEAFGSTELWALRMSPGLVGTDARRDLPLPANVRRYYMPGTTHGGGPGGFQVAQTTNNRCVLAQNPNPMADTMRALTAALIDWVVKDAPPPPSRYPTLADGTLVAATRRDTGFPDIPGVTFPERLVNGVLDYDFGPRFIASDLSGIVDRQPPIVKRAIPALVPRVDRDGNESSGVQSALHRAPLGTYLGWNLEGSGFFKGQLCGFIGGYVPFAITETDRIKANDPRPSIEERYGTHEGYACAVRRAAEALVHDRFLLRADADRLIKLAASATILPPAAEGSEKARAITDRLCK
ncbi:MAG TPA: alpha/beta hydrolase domain-containing protein [Vicinamibacterales bacterium]